MHFLIAALIGLVSGITSGLFGVGGGIVMVPTMVLLLSPPIRDIKQAIGTSLIVIIPTALMGYGNTRSRATWNGARRWHSRRWRLREVTSVRG